jgi:hypothetical protein
VNDETLQQVSFGLDLFNLARHLDCDESAPVQAPHETDEVEQTLRAIGLRRRFKREAK